MMTPSRPAVWRRSWAVSPWPLSRRRAYIVHHQTTFAGYLEDWEQEREKVLEWHDEAVMDYPVSVAATWQKTFQRLSPKAAALLRLTALLAPEPIPEEMFEKGEEIVEWATEGFPREEDQAETASGPSAMYSRSWRRTR